MNLILATDSYKLTHHAMYPEGTERVYSYFESRGGAQFPETVFFGLQPLLRRLEMGVTWDDLLAAHEIADAHFAGNVFNRAGWEHILIEHGGKLPLRIKAVPEGTPVHTGNVLMTVENTDPAVPWLTNALESFLTHVWYPSTVASLSRRVKEVIGIYLEATTGSRDGLEFMLHDFGYRGATTHDAAAIGGAGHLVNFVGTDTLPAIDLAMREYGANLSDLAFSVPATEHSVMTSLGADGEGVIVRQLLEKFPSGILSVVADSYDYYDFVSFTVGERFKADIIARDGVFVVRPDSVTKDHDTPESLVAWTLDQLWADFGGEVNDKGYKVLDSHVRVLWGDGIDQGGISLILQAAQQSGFAASNLVFGMGGGLLQKINRDTQRFAFKSSAQMRHGEWNDVFKRPLDVTKTSKAGRLSLIPYDHDLVTVAWPDDQNDVLQTVFEHGVVTRRYNFDQIRANAALASNVPVTAPAV